MAFPFGADTDIEGEKSEDKDELEDDEQEPSPAGLTDSEITAILEQPVFGVGEGPLLDLEDHAVWLCWLSKPSEFHSNLDTFVRSYKTIISRFPVFSIVGHLCQCFPLG